MGQGHYGVGAGAPGSVARHQLEDAISENASWARRVANRKFTGAYLWRDEIEAAALEALWHQVEAWLRSGKTYPLRRFAKLPIEQAAIDQHRKLAHSVRRAGNKNACSTCDGAGETVSGAECAICRGTGTRTRGWLVVSLDDGERLALAETVPAVPDDPERAEAWAALGRVESERSRQVLAWTLAGWTLEQIGKVYGVTEARASQLLKQARADLMDVLAAA